MRATARGRRERADNDILRIFCSDTFDTLVSCVFVSIRKPYSAGQLWGGAGARWGGTCVTGATHAPTPPLAASHTRHKCGEEHKTSASAVPHTAKGRASEARVLWLIHQRWYVR